MDIVIRHAEPDDYRAIHDIHAQPAAFSGTLQLPFPSAETWKRRLADKPDGLYPLVACVDGAVVGMLGVWIEGHSPRRRHAAGVGMAVHDRWQGRGVGTVLMKAGVDLADNWLGLTRLELNVFVDNEPAIRLYRRFGFEIEGTLRGYAMRDGVLVDALYMARLHEASPFMTHREQRESTNRARSARALVDETGEDR